MLFSIGSIYNKHVPKCVKQHTQYVQSTRAHRLYHRGPYISNTKQIIYYSNKIEKCIVSRKNHHH